MTETSAFGARGVVLRIGLGLGLVLCGASAACSSSHGSAAPLAQSAAPPPEPQSVTTAWVATQPAAGAVLSELPARVLIPPGARAEIMAPFRAQVAQILVEPGQRVSAGTPLVTVLMPEVLRAAGALQAAALRITAYEQRRDQLAVLRSEGLARLADAAEVAASLADARAAQREALAVLRAAGLGAAEAAALAEGSGRAALRSPIDGIVTEVGAALGQIQEPGAAPLVRIAGQGAARVEARLPPLGTAALRYELVTADGGRWPLRLRERAPVLDPRDGTALAWLEPEAGAAPLLGGQTGRVRVLLAEDDAARGADVPLLLPARAVRLSATQAEVRRRRGDEPAAWVPVTVLASAVGQSVVRGREPGALVPSDRVAADAAQVDAEGGGGAP
ncbi:MAG: efflux RND transporter periplasmic adaptor subunit [Polyangia bacterium]